MKTNNENLYARYLSGELSEEELQALRENGDDMKLQAIINEVDSWALPELKAETFDKIVKGTREVKVISINRTRYVMMAAAASVALVLGFFLWFADNSNDIIIAGNVGEIKEVTLPDQTHVILKGNSSIQYDADNFLEDRLVHLTGGVYFDVQQKGDFEVEFDEKTVHVLGTKFEIIDGKNLTSVQCYEGKVKLVIGEMNTVLTAGQGSRTMKDESIEVYDVDVNYKPDTSQYFNNAPLAEVLSFLEVHYDVEFIVQNIDLKRKYTGGYPLSNINTALKLVFDPMNVSYQIDGKIIYLRNK